MISDRTVDTGIVESVFILGLAFDQIFNRFLRELTPQQRTVFLKRYWLMMDCGEIAADTGIKLNTVKTILARTRQRLTEYLKKEGVEL